MNENLKLYDETQITRVNSNLAILKSVSAFSEKQIEELKYTSFYSGHLNLIYSVSNDDPIIDQLKSLLIFDRRYVGSESHNPGLNWSAFQSLISPYLRVETRLFGFGHDGEPLCIFDGE